MRLLYQLFFSITLSAIAWSGPAAADVFSPALITTPNRGVICSIVNVGNDAVSVTIQVVEADQGTVLGTKDAVIAPGLGSTFTYIATQGAQYCAFLGRFPAKSVRANALMADLTAGAVVLSAPAQ